MTSSSLDISHNLYPIPIHVCLIPNAFLHCQKPMSLTPILLFIGRSTNGFYKISSEIPSPNAKKRKKLLSVGCGLVELRVRAEMRMQINPFTLCVYDNNSSDLIEVLNEGLHC